MAWTLISLGAEASANAGPLFVDFVYVDANEGSASGGHVALTLGDRTYHFGHHEPGVLRLDRDDSAFFVRVYGTLENRNLKVFRVPVSPETFDGMRASFNQRYLHETREFALLEEIGRDRRFLEQWREGDPTVSVRGLGYFGPPQEGDSPGAVATALDRLARQVVERHGEQYLARRLGSARATLAGLAGRARRPAPALAPEGHHPAGGYGFSQRAIEAQSLIEAIDILQSGASLQQDSRIALEPADFPLDESRRRMLGVFARKLERDLVATVASSRSDVGFVLLVGMARLLALEETLASGRLVVLDVFPPDAIRLTASEIEARGGQVDRLVSDVQAELESVGEVLARKPAIRESDYGALEAIANRFEELRRSRASGADVRAFPGRLLPALPAQRRIRLAARPPDLLFAPRIVELQERGEAQYERLDGKHHYNLLTHNCVSELFAQIDRAFGGEGASPAEASRKQLGGHVPPGRGLEFIPFLAADAIGSGYRVDEVVTLSSYRRRQVEAMAAREGSSAVWRESNVFTSTLYAPNSMDSAFLFFTDDVLLARPLLGAANLFYGLGATVVGLPTAPFDGGQLFWAGLRGALFSLPELFFSNIRKGSFFSVPRAEPASVCQEGSWRSTRLPDSPTLEAAAACADRR